MAAKMDNHTSFYPGVTSIREEDGSSINATLNDNCHPMLAIAAQSPCGSMQHCQPYDIPPRWANPPLGFSRFSEDDRTVIYLGVSSDGTASAFFVPL